MGQKRAVDGCGREDNNSSHGQKKLIKLRREVNRLFFRKGMSKNAIARQKRVSKHFVICWTKSPHQDFTADNRGWPKGCRRKWDTTTEKRVAELHQILKSDPRVFFWGATAIEQAWRQHYPGEPVPPLRTLGQILRELGLAERYQKRRRQGAARYLCYPEQTIYEQLGTRVLEADFIQKYLRGHSQPLHFIAFAFKKAPRLRHFQRIAAATAENFIDACKIFFDRFEKPDCLKVDNAAATIGSRSGKRNLSRVMNFLLSNQIVPIYAVPRRPFSQATVEGNNSVFSRKFWKSRTFQSVADVDEQLAWFNESSRLYTGYQPPAAPAAPKGPTTFIPRVYFLRQVRELENHAGGIEVLNEIIELPAAFIPFIVLAEWHLADETLSVYLEREEKLHIITSVPFPINPSSLKSLGKDNVMAR